MKTLRRLLVILAALAAGTLVAQEPARTAGRVLLLQSDRGLEGDIERIGEQYRIRRGTSEVWLSGEKVLRLCADWDDVYNFMKSRANLGDPDERLRLARWCQLNNLRPQALGEAKAALELRPRHEETRQLVTMLTRSLAALPAPAPQAPAPAATRATHASLPADISADCFGLFATRVQPILMNACVTCHSGGRGGAFQLVRTDGSQRAFTQANLAATLAYVNLSTPVLSQLLIKAVSRHGDATQAPIKDRQAIPFQTLQAWIEHVRINNPHLRSEEREAVAVLPSTPPAPVAFAQGQARARPMAVSQPVPRIDSKEGGQPGRLPPLPEATPLNPGVPGKAAPAAPSNSSDPFDPEPFNRQRK